MVQLGQDAIIATLVNLNFTETISSRIRQCGQPSVSFSREPISRGKTATAPTFAFADSPAISLFFVGLPDVERELSSMMLKGIANHR
jgi:hypothetical protein